MLASSGCYDSLTWVRVSRCSMFLILAVWQSGYAFVIVWTFSRRRGNRRRARIAARIIPLLGTWGRQNQTKSVKYDND